MALQPVLQRAETLADSAYARLCEALIDGSLQPGDRLVMDKLGADLNISRTPVREALQRLERERVVRPTGGKGYMVCTLDDDELDQMYAAREAVEGYAAVVVSQQPASHAALRAAFAEAGAMPYRTPVEVYTANRHIHRAVLLETGNRHLTEMFDLVWSRGLTSQVWADLAAHGAPGADLHAQHQPLLEAIVSGDADRAQEASVRHIRDGRTLHHDEPTG